jgi:hypothetical protein
MTVISPTAAQALYDAVAHIGRNKGQLKAKCPPSHTLAAAAWQAATLVCNPYKASIASMMFMSPEQKAIFNEIKDILDRLPKHARIALDRDRAALESLGVW